MGYLANNECFVTPQLAAQAACSAFPKSSVDGGETVVVSCLGVTEDGSALQLQRITSTATTTEDRAVAFGSCDPLERYTDVGTIWALGLAAAVSVYALKQFVLRNVWANH